MNKLSAISRQPSGKSLRQKRAVVFDKKPPRDSRRYGPQGTSANGPPLQWRVKAPTSTPVPLGTAAITHKSRRPPAHVLAAIWHSLRMVAGAARRPALFPQLFPIPDLGSHFNRQRESELMRKHTHLPTMVGFVRKHVAQHFQSNRPGSGPSVSAEFLDAAHTTAERFSQHLRTASGTLGQSYAGLLRCAVRAVELSWNLQMRSCKPDPLAAYIVYVGEDRGDGTGARRAGRFGCRRSGPPGAGVKMFDKNLVHALIGDKNLHCCSANFSVNTVLTIGVWTRGHRSLP